ncbi:hypothetical protein ACF09Y_21400 [Streptomyces massasporeus]|uniref:hypothetical protein n=1 Tax=Streptomyces massasporeus TaxID=67324 RepID=UPI0037029F37
MLFDCRKTCSPSGIWRPASGRRAGTSVPSIGSGASGRNGSVCAQSIPINTAAARNRYCVTRAREPYDAFSDAVEESTRAERLDVTLHHGTAWFQPFGGAYFTTKHKLRRADADGSGTVRDLPLPSREALAPFKDHATGVSPVTNVPGRHT